MDNPSAFPCHLHPDSADGRGMGGMTLRDWFAGQAIGGVIRQCSGDFMIPTPDHPATIEEYFAIKAYAIADAMLALRTSGETK